MRFTCCDKYLLCKIMHADDARARSLAVKTVQKYGSSSSESIDLPASVIYVMIIVSTLGTYVWNYSITDRV